MRIIFITGVSRGLGQSLANALADDNTRLIGLGRTRGEFTGEFHTCDFTKPPLAASIFETALSEADLGDATSVIFISNAGRLGPIGRAQNLDAFDIEQTIAANLCGAAIAASAFLKRVEALPLPKLFVQISSGAALPDRAKAGWSLYCACKAGQEQLIRSIALEQRTAKHPTKMINLNPGVMETAMQAEIRSAPPEAFPEVEDFIKMSKEGRIPSSDKIADEIRELLEDLAPIESGQTYTLANYKK